MKKHTLRWLYAIPGRKKLYILMLMFVQALNGASGVVYAVFLRNIVDSATEGEKRSSGFMSVCLLHLCVCR